MLKYIFTTVPTTISDQSYRKVLTWRNYVSVITALLVVIAGSMIAPKNHSSYLSIYLSGLTGGAIGVTIAFLFKFQQIRRQTDEQIHQQKIKETDERHQYNNLRALKISYILLICTLYTLLMYFSSQDHFVESFIIFLIISVSLGSYYLIRILFNRYQ